MTLLYSSQQVPLHIPRAPFSRDERINRHPIHITTIDFPAASQSTLYQPIEPQRYVSEQSHSAVLADQPLTNLTATANHRRQELFPFSGIIRRLDFQGAIVPEMAMCVRGQ